MLASVDGVVDLVSLSIEDRRKIQGCVNEFEQTSCH